MARYIGFHGSTRFATGSLDDMAVAARHVASPSGTEPVLVFDAQTSEQIDLDLRGTDADVAARALSQDAARTAPGETRSPGAPKGPGRPRLGVVAREVTLLPRHWTWLATQPGGASAALRRLVEDARRSHSIRDQRRVARESAYRFMSAIAGNEPGFEEAMRALFGSRPAAFYACIASWPPDVRAHAEALTAQAWDAAAEPGSGDGDRT
jgi:uncharacterized protein